MSQAWALGAGLLISRELKFIVNGCTHSLVPRNCPNCPLGDFIIAFLPSTLMGLKIALGGVSSPGCSRLGCNGGAGASGGGGALTDCDFGRGGGTL